MSILTTLHRQNLIAERNNLQLNTFRNYDAQRNLLSSPSFGSDVDYAALSAKEAALEGENISNSAQLMSINAELEALNNSSSKLNYMA